MDEYYRSYEYVDVRGVWPVYILGTFAVQLEGCHRGITLEAARAVVAGLNT